MAKNSRREVLAAAHHQAVLAAHPQVQQVLEVVSHYQRAGRLPAHLPTAVRQAAAVMKQDIDRAEQQQAGASAARELVHAAQVIDAEGLVGHVNDLAARGGWAAVRNALGPHLSPAALAMADATVQQAGGFHGLVEGIARTSWEILATDPVQLKAFIEERGPDAARAAFEQNGAADLLPVAAKAWTEHAVAQESDAAAAKYQAMAQDPTSPAVRSGLSGLLTDPALHQLAAQFYASRGLQPEPGKTALESLLQNAAVMDDRSFVNANRTPRVDAKKEAHEVDAELAKFYKCDVETVSTILDVMRDAKTHYGLHKRLSERDSDAVKNRKFDLKPEPSAATRGEQGRRAALEKGMAQAEKRAAPEQSYDLNGNLVSHAPSAMTTITVESGRKAALAQGYAKLSGENVRLKFTSDGERRVLETAKRRDDEREQHTRSRRGVLEAAHDRLGTKTTDERPASTERAQPRTEAQQGSDRRAVLERAYDAGAAEASTTTDDTDEENA